jgi:hypothetical protein
MFYFKGRSNLTVTQLDPYHFTILYFLPNFKMCYTSFQFIFIKSYLFYIMLNAELSSKVKSYN